MNVFHALILSLILSACADDQKTLTKLEEDCFEFSVNTQRYLESIPLTLKYINEYSDFKKTLKLHDENLERFDGRLFDCVFSIATKADGFDEDNRKRIINVHRELISVRSVVGVYSEKLENVSDDDISGVRSDVIRMLEISLKK